MGTRRLITQCSAGQVPTTQYADIVVQPWTKDLVLATHGRGIWTIPAP